MELSHLNLKKLELFLVILLQYFNPLSELFNQSIQIFPLSRVGFFGRCNISIQLSNFVSLGHTQSRELIDFTFQALPLILSHTFQIFYFHLADFSQSALLLQKVLFP